MSSTRRRVRSEEGTAQRLSSATTPSKNEDRRRYEAISHQRAHDIRQRFSHAETSFRNNNNDDDDEVFRPAARSSLAARHSHNHSSFRSNVASDDDGFRRPKSSSRGGGSHRRIFNGLLSAPITPYTNGKADVSIIRNEYAELHRADNIDGVFCCGTTGESMSLSSAERMQACEAWVDTGLQVCCHITAQSLPETQKLAKHAQDAGVDAIAVMCPAFFKPAAVANYVEFLEEVYRAAPQVPMLVYHFPLLTGINFSLYNILVEGIKRIPTLRGAKFTSHDLGDYAACQSLGGQITDMIYSIEGNMFAAAFSGCSAFVGMQFSMIAPCYRRVWEAAARGDAKRANAENAHAVEFQLAMQQSCAGFSLEKAVALTKHVVSLRLGRDCGEPRAPGARLTSQEKSTIERVVLPFCSEFRRQEQRQHRHRSSSRRRNNNNNDDESSRNKHRLIL